MPYGYFDRRVKIVPDLAAADFSQLPHEVEAIEQEGADWVHLDVRDGTFADGITFGEKMCASMRRHVRSVLNIHLRVNDAERHLERFAGAKPDFLTIHVEGSRDAERSLSIIRDLNCRPGIALNTSTHESNLEYILDHVELVCILTSPDRGARSFNRCQLQKLRRVREMIGERDIHLAAFGNITEKSAQAVGATGADVLIAGASVFQNGSVLDPGPYGRNIAALRAAASSEAPRGAVNRAATAREQFPAEPYEGVIRSTVRGH